MKEVLSWPISLVVSFPFTICPFLTPLTQNSSPQMQSWIFLWLCSWLHLPDPHCFASGEGKTRLSLSFKKPAELQLPTRVRFPCSTWQSWLLFSLDFESNCDHQRQRDMLPRKGHKLEFLTTVQIWLCVLLVSYLNFLFFKRQNLCMIGLAFELL
jgi:hypothetical protein